MPFDADSAFQLMLGIALGAARLTPCMLMVPAFCFKHLKGPLRYAVVIAVALIPAPSIGEALSGQAESFGLIIGLLLKEVALGALLGVLLHMPFWMFASVGALLDSQRGALSGGQMNPALGPDATPMGELFQETLVMLLIVLGGLPLILQVIWDSYLIWPPTAWLPILDGDGLAVLLELLSRTLHHMLLYAAPFIAVLLLIEAVMAIISLYAQQLNVFILAMPAKSIAGIAFLLIYLPTLLELASGEIQHIQVIGTLLGDLLKVPAP
ncbi:type III secretion system export apparatus subunit SctT [Pseudomonas sp. LRF_L74]|uniref:type III secretion system export apparatus subunit SctT n=1 Tax=Pseudomonas sp. LRF_L74 TaxID=3369422 RepID=UPI003F629D15